MKKRILALISIFSLIITLLPQTLVKAEINQAGVDYLKAQTQSAWITMALAAAGETSLDLSHLETVNGNTATDYEKTILALASVGENPRTFGNIDYVNELKTTFYSNNQLGDEALLNDDIWGILALIASGESSSSQIILDAKSFLLTNQNQDGGWSYSVGGDSDTNDTASAIMALLEAGLTSSSTEILEAIEYLKNMQNSDGGFPYTAGSDSDSGSDSWVISAIYKLGQDPTSTAWQNNSNNAVDHLKSLQAGDGSFKWLVTNSSGSTAMTVSAVIALAEKYYPIIGQQVSPQTYHLRIEGSAQTFCNAQVAGPTVKDALENGSTICNYTYVFQDSDWGPYLSQINNDAAAGVSGWMYFVNNVGGAIAMDLYTLQLDDEILLYYGDWGWMPTKITLQNDQIDVGGEVNILAEFHNGTEWLILPEAEILIGQDSYTAQTDGTLTTTLDTGGVYQVYTQTTGYVRSQKQKLIVGTPAEENVGLKVEVDQGGNGNGNGDGGGNNNGPEVSFEVSTSNLDFGSMDPGENDQKSVKLTNNSQVPIYVEGQVLGDDLFINNLQLDSTNWIDFYSAISVGSDQDVEVGLNIPSGYTSEGVKTGDLTFWAIGTD